MRRSTATPAVLLFFSGACALTYQTVWLRQFRLIFGGSTFATAAVLAIFMGGLGLGSAILGRRADAHTRPLVFYGHLELLISAFSAASVVLLWLVAKLYFALGGAVTLGIGAASAVRLLLAAAVRARCGRVAGRRQLATALRHARRRCDRRLRVSADGARLVSHARSAARRFDIHVRAHPCCRASRHRCRRRCLLVLERPGARND